MNVVKEIFVFIHNSNVNPRYHCDQSEIHLNKIGTDRLIENLLLDSWHKAHVSMSINVYRKQVILNNNF